MNINNDVLVSVHSTLPIFEFPQFITEVKDGNAGSYCFQDVKNIVEEISFGENPQIKKIGSYAFFECNKLKSVNFSMCKNLNSLGERSFGYCEQLEYISFPELDNFNYFGEYTFYQTGLKSVHLPKTLKKINGSYSFGRCYNLKSVTFSPGNKLTSIGFYTFAYCYNLTDIIFPNTTNNIEGALGKTNISKLKVEEGNPYYSEYEGNLYSNDYTTFKVAAPQSKGIKFHPNCKSINTNSFMWINFDELEVPARITSLQPYAFYFCEVSKIILKNITSLPNNCFTGSTSSELILNEGLKQINNMAFSSMQNLRRIEIPSTVEELNNAFASIKKPLEIVFNNNQHFTSINGNMLCNSDKTRLIMYTGNEDEVHVPASIINVDGSAFANTEASSIIFDGNLVESFGADAFKGMPNLKTFTIPPTVTSIAMRCFSGSHIEDLRFDGKSVSLDKYVMSASFVKSATFGDGVTEIPVEAALGSTLLETVRISSKVQSIAKDAFKNCISLATIIFEKSSEGDFSLTIGESAFAYCGLETLKLPTWIESISPLAFSNNTKLLSVDLSSTSLTVLNSGLFSNCEKLASVKYPNNLEKILNRCFSNCGFTIIGISQTVIEIEANAFSDCQQLTTISFDTSTRIERIVSTSFRGCSKLASFTFSTTSEESRFTQIDGVLVDKYNKKLCIYPPAKAGLTYSVPPSLKEVGDYAFLDSQLEQITIGSGVEKIGVEAFNGCKSLKYLELEMEVLEANPMMFVGVELGCGTIAFNMPIYDALVKSMAPAAALRPCPTEAPDVIGGQCLLIACLIDALSDGE